MQIGYSCAGAGTQARPCSGEVGLYCPRISTGDVFMKVVEIVPRDHARLFAAFVAKEAAIRKNGRGTYEQVGRKTGDAARWRHKKFGGAVALKRDRSEVVTARIRAANPENERRLLSSFLGFVDRYSDDQVASITIHYQ